MNVLMTASYVSTVPDTFQALAVTLIAVLPGALYTWAVERESGAWGVKLSDRILRFVGVSAIFIAFSAIPLRWLWATYLHAPVTVNGQTEYHNMIVTNQSLPTLWWLIPIVYVATPFALGTLSGRILANRRALPRLARVLAGPNPAPTAWDDLFSRRPAALIRIRLKPDAGGGWVAGVFGSSSYASGYGEDPADVYLEELLRLKADGSFAAEAGKIVRAGYGAIIKRDDIAVMEVFPRGGG